MHIAPARPHTALSSGHAAMHSAGAAGHSHLRPKITEDVYSGTQDSESLWMSSAWRGQEGDQPQQEQSASAAASSAPPPPTQSASTPLAIEALAPAATASGKSISLWA